VVDATDRLRVDDCRDELAGLLLEEVRLPISPLACKFSLMGTGLANTLQRLMGASLLIFLNKTDVEGCMTEDEVREVSCCRVLIYLLGSTDIC
jgi:ADP-ribosylation factor-like protein 2